MTKQTLKFSFIKTVLLLISLFTINLVYAATITWNGSSSNDWSTASNWDLNRTPISTDDVIIPKTSNDPILTSNNTFTVNNVEISKNSTFTNNSILIIIGDLTGEGTYKHNTQSSYLKIYGSLKISNYTNISSKGAFEFAGNNQILPSGEDFYKVIISGNGTIINSNIAFKNIFTINSFSTLIINTGKILTLTGTSAVINGTISGSGTLALNIFGGGSSNNLLISGSGTISSLVTMADEVTLVDGATVNLGSFTVNNGQTFINNNILYYTPGTEPIINGTLSGTGLMIIGTGVTYTTVGDKGRFELTGSVNEIRTSTTAYTNLYEYGTTTKTTVAGVNSGTKYRTFTIPATAPARLASGNARVAAGGRVFSLGSSPVPVTFVGFDGVLQGNSALISWATSMEYNNKEFIVEASADAVNFTQVASVNGVGTTNSLSNYSVKVANPLKYYRLKQVDFDGVSTYSKIIEVSGENINEFSIYPNPFVDNDLYVNYNGSTEVDGVIVKIYDLNEKVHFESTLNFFGNEVTKLQLTEKLNKGIYFVSIQSQTGVKIQKLLVEY